MLKPFVALEWLDTLKQNLLHEGVCKVCGQRKKHDQKECPYAFVITYMGKILKEITDERRQVMSEIWAAK